jgi:hypothetical protein
MDDSSLGLAKYLSVSRAPENRSRHKDTELDKIYDEHLRQTDPEKRKAMIRAFEKRAFENQDRDGLEDVAEPQSRPAAGGRVAEYVRR